MSEAPAIIEDEGQLNLTAAEKDAIAFVGVMVKYQDVGFCAKLLGIDYEEAWRIYNTPEYARARVRLLNNADPAELYSKTDAVEALIEESRNVFDGDPKSRIAAVAKLCEILGYMAPTEHHLTGDMSPVIALTLEPPRPEHRVIEIDPEEVTEEDLL